MDFVTGLLISNNWKKDSYDSILVIINQLTKIVYYKPVKITINAPVLAEDIMDVVIQHHGFLNLMVTNRGSSFISKFWSLLWYFLGIKCRLFTAFHPWIDSQIIQQNSTMEAYLWVFVNFEQNDWAGLLPTAKFAYNNAKNASIGHTPFKLNCGYYLCISLKENTNPHFWSKIADKLSAEL